MISFVVREAHASREGQQAPASPQTVGQVQRPPAVILGLDCVTGLQTARILADHRVPVIGLAKNPKHFACRTKAVQRVLQADTSGPGLIQALEELGPGLGEKAVLFPCTDMSVALLSRHRERLSPWYHLALPDPEVVETLLDKVRFAGFVQKAGLPAPQTFVLRTARDAQEAARRLRYPCLLKPAMKTPAWEEGTKAKVFRVESEDELLALYARSSQWVEELVAQEWVEGPDTNLFTCNGYFDRHSQPLVTFVSQKLRQWPPRAGTGSLAVEVRNQRVQELCVELFRRVGFHGLGYVEVKRDSRTGEYVILEANIGRPTGRSAMAEASGVELLYTMYADLVGLPLPANRRQRYQGMKWIYLRQDLRSAFVHWRRGELSLAEWWRSWQGPKRYAVLSWRDPAPFLYGVWRDLRTLAARLAERRPPNDRPKARTRRAGSL